MHKYTPSRFNDLYFPVLRNNHMSPIAQLTKRTTRYILQNCWCWKMVNSIYCGWCNISSVEFTVKCGGIINKLHTMQPCGWGATTRIGSSACRVLHSVQRLGEFCRDINGRAPPQTCNIKVLHNPPNRLLQTYLLTLGLPPFLLRSLLIP